MAISLRRLILIFFFIPFSFFPFIGASGSGINAPPLIGARENKGFQSDAGECTPESKFSASDRVEGFNGLAIEYSVDGLPVSEFQDHDRVLSGYPSGSQVTINFTFYGPYSIEGNWATSAKVLLNKKEIEYVRAPDKGGEPGWSYIAKPVVVTITDEIRQNGFDVTANVGYGRSSNSEDVFVSVRGLKCDRPVPAEQPPAALPVMPTSNEETGLPWVIIVAGVAGTAALAAAAIQIVRTATKRLGRPPETNETAGFILQLSQKDFTLAESAQTKLRATAWRVTGAGQPQLASDAVITIQPPAPSSGVTVTPLRGNGDQFFTLSRAGKGSSAPVVFYISASTAESASEVQQVTVRMGSNFTARANDKKSFDVVFNPVEKRWSLPEIVCCFRDNNDLPEKTAFEWGAPRPPVVFSPAGYVEMDEFYVHDAATNAFTIKLRLRKGLDFLKDPEAAAWLEQDGVVDATVTVQDDTQQTYTDTVRLHFRPQLRLVAFSYEKDLTHPGSHTYLNNRWEGMQFLADGVDQLHLALCYVRTDKEITRGQEYLSAEKDVEIERPDWETGSFLLPPEADAANTRDGVWAFAISSNDCVRPTVAFFRKKYQLKVRAKISTGGNRNYTFEKPEETVTVDPQFLLARFWVIPGLYRGTSLALAYVKTVPSNKPLMDFPLHLSVLNQGSGWLSLDNCSADQKTSSVDEPKYIKWIQKSRGVAVWTLRYSGLTWENLSTAQFQVTCEGPQGRVGPVVYASETVDVNKNVHDMLKALFEDKVLQDGLNNPYWKDSSLPMFCRGLTWNIFQWFDTERPYVCHNMRGKILDWLKERRSFHHDEVWSDVELDIRRTSCMNGIEYESYELLLVHVYAGFFLSGNPQTDFKALDPWWEQRWDDPALKEPENLMTMKGEVWNIAKMAGVIGLMATTLVEMFLAIGVKIGYATVVTLIKGLLAGKKFTMLLVKLGLADHVVSTYAVDIHSVVSEDTYYPSTEWFANALKLMDKLDEDKCKGPVSGS